jgi:uncharacterized membrane protein
MDFEKLLKDSWEKYLPQFVNLILFTFVGTVLCVTVILIPVVMPGMAIGFLGYVRDGRKPEFSDLWTHWDKYIPVLFLMIVAGFLTMIGFMLFIIPGMLLSTIWLYSLYFIVDKDMGFWAAMKASQEAVKATGMGNNFVVFLLIGGINSLGSAAAFFGVVLTLPFTMLILTHAYLEASRKPQSVSNAPA